MPGMAPVAPVIPTINRTSHLLRKMTFRARTFVHKWYTRGDRIESQWEAKEAHITDHDDPGSLLKSPLHLLRRALQNYTAHWQATIPEITAPQYAILLTVRDDPGADQSRISTLTSIDVATLTPVLVRLEQRGLITRKVDPHNKRRKLLFLTDEGRGLVARVRKLAVLVDDAALDGLSSPQIDALIQTLRCIATRPRETTTEDGTDNG